MPHVAAYLPSRSGAFFFHVVVSFAGYWNGSLVAVKVLEQVAGDFNPRSSLEPLLHHRLSHPNIVAMFDVCTQVGGTEQFSRES
jgi:hypothetical protein